MHCGRNEHFFGRTTARHFESGHNAFKLLIVAALAVGFPGGCTEEPRRPAVALAPAEAQMVPPQDQPQPAAKARLIAKPVEQAHAGASEEPAPTLNPVVLLGMRPAATIKLLGAPIDTQQQAMATKWTYRKGSCSLAIFFYPDISNGAMRALRYDFDNAKPAATTGASCDRQIVLARNDK